ncbi:hypothetical protein [Flavobacterium sp. MDT1-60]|uniref:hypothetical protein n=1 Tax=Flavobacterium sp. MDT1-60 TaxID=1979344 RepID=UPI00177B1004|nr:hypothetical protein [Flavobacterium sp. MDT1-60]QOG01052.1 hypothetical protein IHE43_14645 [Flavobacterium sp. MDT1-60]
MKKIGIAFMLMFCFLSCSNSEANSAVITYYYGKWKLTKMTRVFIPALYINGNPQWQEFYDFKTDRTFVKTRIQETTKTYASGKFEIIKIKMRHI